MDLFNSKRGAETQKKLLSNPRIRQQQNAVGKGLGDVAKVAGTVLAAPLIMPALGAAGGAIGSGLGAAGGAIGSGLGAAGSAISSGAGAIGSGISQVAGSAGNFLGQNQDKFLKIAGDTLGNQTNRLEQEAYQGNSYITPLQRRQQMMRNQAYQGA